MRSAARVSVLFAALASLSLAQEKPDPFLAERILAPNALLFLSVPQSAAASEDFGRSNLAKLMNHPEIRSFLEPVEAWWKKRKTQQIQVGGQMQPAWNDMVRQTTGVSIDELWGLLQGPLSFAVYDVPVSEQHKLDLVLTLGAEDGAGLEKAAGLIRDTLKEQGGFKEGEYKRQGVTIREIGSDEVRIYYAFVQRTLLAATRQERIEQLLDAAADPAFAGLREDAAFKAARARVSAESRHLFLLHANLAQAFKQFRRELGDEALRVLDTLGVSDITSIAASLGYDGPWLRERYALMTSQQTRGLLKFVAGGAAADPLARWVPAGALQYGHFNINLAETYDVFLAASKVSPNFERDLQEMLGEYERRAGIRLREALATVGSSWTTWASLPEGGGLFPDAINAVSLADPAKFEAAVDKVAKDAGLRFDEMTFRGQKIRYLSIGVQEMGAPGLDLGWMSLIKFGTSFGYFIRDNTLYLATNPLALKRQILRFAAPPAPIAKDERYAALAARAGRDAGESWLYMDLGRHLNLAYGTLEPFVHFFRDLARDPQTGELIVDAARMPLGETLADLVGATFAQKRTAPDAILLDSWSNTGVSLSSSLGLVAASGAVAVPMFMRMRGGAAMGGVAQNEMIAEVSLQLIRQAQETFKNSDSDRNGAADYWTRDVAGLYALKDRSGQAIFLLDPQTAQADPDGAARYGLAASPKNGYFYRAMVTDGDGEAYQKDDDKDGSAFTNKGRYAVVSWPAQYGATGKFTFITSEAGKIWKKDTQGAPLDRWPGKDPAEAGWQLAE